MLTGTLLVAAQALCGANGSLVLRGVALDADMATVASMLPGDLTLRLVRTDNIRVRLDDADMILTAPPSNPVVALDFNAANCQVRGGVVEVIAAGVGPLLSDINVFRAGNAARVDVLGDVETAVQLYLLSPPTPPSPPPPPSSPAPSVNYVLAETASVAYVGAAVLDYETVALGSGFLASADASSLVMLNGIKMVLGFVPAIHGDGVDNITYVAMSSGGNVEASGGSYTRTVRVSSDADRERFVHDNDGTIIVQGADPPATLLPDPADVSGQVIYSGKIVVVKNINPPGGAAAVVRATPPSVLFEATPVSTLLVPPGGAVTLQNDGTNWLVLTRTP